MTPFPKKTFKQALDTYYAAMATYHSQDVTNEEATRLAFSTLLDTLARPVGWTLVLANGSMSSNTSGEGEIRKQIIEADLVDCMVALPGNLFYSTQIPVCLWFLARSKHNGRFRDRRGETLFIDARKLGVLIDRVHRDLTDEEIAQIAGTYHAWRGDAGAGEYADVPGFCKRATTDDIRGHGYVLTPGRYVGAAEVEEDDEPFAAKMERLTTTLAAQMTEGARLDAAIRDNLRSLGYDLTQTKAE